MTSKDRSVAAALAITFEDRVVRRHLALRYPLDLERAKLALEIADRRERRLEAEREADDQTGPTPDDDESTVA